MNKMSNGYFAGGLAFLIGAITQVYMFENYAVAACLSLMSMSFCVIAISCDKGR